MSDQLFDVPESLSPRLASWPNGQVPAMTPKRRAILDYLAKNKTITLAQAADLVGKDVYYNELKHTGALLSAMVKLGMIVRVKVGVFSIRNEDST